MKIAHVVVAFPPDLGGMGKVAFDEAKELTRRGHEVTVFTLAYPLTRYEDDKLPFRVVRVKPLIPGVYGDFWPKLRGLLAGFDLVHLHYPFYGSAEWVWLQKTPYIVTYHMDSEPTVLYHKMIKKFYDKFLATRILQKAKRVILVDPLNEFKLKDKLFPEQIAEIPNGIDTDVFKHNDSTSAYELALEDLIGKKIFIFVGNLLPVKGLPILLEAWKKMPEDALLIVVGSGYREHEYQAAAEKFGVQNRVHWIGALSPENLAKYYSISEAAIVPSLSESFSLVAAEAMACECPVIGSDLLGMRSRVIDGETGFVFKKGSVENLAGVLNKFIKLPESERKRMGAKGRELVEMKFSLKKHVDTLEAIYKNCV